MTRRATMVNELTMSPARPTRTYVIESHADDPVGCLSELASGNVEYLEDAYLFRVRTSSGVFLVDQLDERFWRFHTDAGHVTYPLLRDWVSSRRDLDWMWLPSEHLRNLWPGARSKRVRTEFKSTGLVNNDAAAQDLRVQLHGSNAEELFDLIAQSEKYRSAISFDAVEAVVSDEAFSGTVREGVDRMGIFAVAGDSLELHLQFVSTVVERYRRLVVSCEEKAIRWRSSSGDLGGGTVVGGPIVLQFSREIGDVGFFAEKLASSGEPFRIWGIVDVNDNVAEVEAVDLHVGKTIQLDIGTNWMRIYLQDGGCGNTVARLITNLQHRFDGALTLRDLELEAVKSGPADAWL